MSHPKVVEYAKFYNQYYVKKQTAEQATGTVPRSVSPQKDPSRAPHPPYRGDIGYSAELSKKMDLSLLAPPKQHCLKHGELGLGAVHIQRQNLFTELPGVTFNQRSWQKFQDTASSLRRSVSPSKVRR